MAIVIFDPILPLFYTILRIVFRFNASRNNVSSYFLTIHKSSTESCFSTSFTKIIESLLSPLLITKGCE
ncbi:hypothetical protein ACLOJK_040532 [Asimina triloba]